MKKQHIIYRLCFAVSVINLILLPLLPMFSFDLAIATTDTNKPQNSKPRRQKKTLRLKGAKPGGDTNTVNGSILIPEESNVAQEDSPDTTPFIARFRKEVYFQVKVWDPSQGNRDGDGIERIEISISKDNQTIYNHTEKFSPYCFFENGSPCGSINKFWPSDQPIENGEYGGYIEIYRKNNSQPAQWFFRFEIQRPN